MVIDAQNGPTKYLNFEIVIRCINLLILWVK